MARKALSKSAPTIDQVFTAVFDRIAEKGYGKARLSDLAQALDVPLADLYAEYQSIDAIIYRFLDQIDQRMIEDAVLDSESDKRDIYFDLLMSRFDTIQQYRAGFKRWLQDTAKHPLLWAKLLKRWDVSLSLILDLAKDSPVFAVKKVGLAAVYLAGLREWMSDESEDLGKTMVSIDKSLTKAQEFTTRFLTKKKA